MLRTAIKFGVFIVVCLSFAVWLTFTIGNIDLSDPLGRDNFTLTARFDDVSGLLINDDVKIAGVTVGKVTSIGVEAGRAIVRFQVDSEYEDVLFEGTTTADIRWRNLIGQRYLYINPGAPAPTTLGDGDEIVDTDDVTDLGALFNTLGPIVASIDESKVNEFMDTVTQALDGNADALGQTLDDLATVTAGLATRDDAIGRLVENLDTVAGTITARDQQIRTMLDNLVTLAQTFSDNSDVVDSALTEFASFSTDLSTLLQRNRDELDRIIGGLDVTVAEEVVPRLDRVRSLLDNLDEAARAVFQAGRNGEWLNQTILCAAVGPPPCLTPVIPGLDSLAVANASVGSKATSPASGSDSLARLVLGDDAADQLALGGGR